MARELTATERTLRSRHKLNRVQVLFKKEHRAQIRIIAMRQNKSFVQFLEDEMDRIIQAEKRRRGPKFAILLDHARDTALGLHDSVGTLPTAKTRTSSLPRRRSGQKTDS